MKLRPIFKCHGGKFYLWDFIVSHFPKDYTKLRYFEGCGGAASVLLNKEKSIEETYNDADTGIAAIVTVLALCQGNCPFLTKVKNTPYSKFIFEWALNAHETEMAEVAYRELILRRMSRGGMRKAFAWSERKRGGMPGDAHAWETFKAELPKIIERLKDVHVYCMKVTDLFRRFDAEDTLWYIDPPYLKDTRASKDVYTVEMTEEEHIELAGLLNKAKGKVLLSGYQSDLYNKLYKGWNVDCRAISNHSGQTKVKQKRIEVLWMNY